MFWHATWSSQAHMTNGFPLYSLEKDAVTASKHVIAKNIDSASVSTEENYLGLSVVYSCAM